MAAAAAATASLGISKLFGIAGKVAVVTGGGRGIGEMISRALVQNGVKVYITSRNATACERTAARLSSEGPGSCIPLCEDLSTQAGVTAFAKRFNEREAAAAGAPPPLHILVNNSGIAWGADFDVFPAEQFDRVFALNVTSIFTLTRALRPNLLAGSSKDDPARVINIGSITGILPQPVPTYSYDISKAAVHHLTRKLSAEFAPEITVNAIAPGFVPSRMSKGLTTYAAEADIATSIPMGRWGDESDMGGAAVYLSSRAGRWVTGQVLVVDGGQTAKPLSMLPAQL